MLENKDRMFLICYVILIAAFVISRKLGYKDLEFQIVFEYILITSVHIFTIWFEFNSDMKKYKQRQEEFERSIKQYRNK